MEPNAGTTTDIKDRASVGWEKIVLFEHCHQDLPTLGSHGTVSSSGIAPARRHSRVPRISVVDLVEPLDLTVAPNVLVARPLPVHLALLPSALRRFRDRLANSNDPPATLT